MHFKQKTPRAYSKIHQQKEGCFCLLPKTGVRLLKTSLPGAADDKRQGTCFIPGYWGFFKQCVVENTSRGFELQFALRLIYINPLLVWFWPMDTGDFNWFSATIEHVRVPEN